MNNEKLSFNVDDIRQIASNLALKREEIMNIYKSKVVPVLDSSKGCLKVSGINYEDIVTSFNNVFDLLNTQLSSLSAVLTNKIIPNYENSTDTIKKYFNSDFANNLSQVLSDMNK